LCYYSFDYWCFWTGLLADYFADGCALVFALNVWGLVFSVETWLDCGLFLWNSTIFDGNLLSDRNNDPIRQNPANFGGILHPNTDPNNVIHLAKPLNLRAIQRHNPGKLRHNPIPNNMQNDNLFRNPRNHQLTHR
jgi:hypothetical protein